MLDLLIVDFKVFGSDFPIETAAFIEPVFFCQAFMLHEGFLTFRVDVFVGLGTFFSASLDSGCSLFVLYYKSIILFYFLGHLLVEAIRLHSISHIMAEDFRKKQPIIHAALLEVRLVLV